MGGSLAIALSAQHIGFFANKLKPNELENQAEPMDSEDGEVIQASEATTTLGGDQIPNDDPNAEITPPPNKESSNDTSIDVEKTDHVQPSTDSQTTDDAISRRFSEDFNNFRPPGKESIVGMTGVSTDLNVTYLSPGGKVGDLISIRAECDKLGRRMAFTQVTFFEMSEDGKFGGKPFARGSHTKYLADGAVGGGTTRESKSDEETKPDGETNGGNQANGLRRTRVSQRDRSRPQTYRRLGHPQ